MAFDGVHGGQQGLSRVQLSWITSFSLDGATTPFRSGWSSRSFDIAWDCAVWGCKRGFDLWWRAEVGLAMARDIATAAAAIRNFLIVRPMCPNVRDKGHVPLEVE
jgi:hypothetical protein